MAYGSPVNIYPSQFATDKGYVIKIDTSDVGFSEIYGVQVKSSTGGYSPVVSESTVESVYNNLQAEAPSEVAFNNSSNEVSVFVNSTTHPYSETSVAFFGYGSPVEADDDADNLNIDSKLLPLVYLYVRRAAWSLKKGYVPQEILDDIALEERKIRKGNL